MTLIDKVGATVAVVIFVLLAIAYFYTFRPKNKQKFKDLSNLVNDED
jgi:preprotein translocase subunit YajC